MGQLNSNVTVIFRDNINFDLKMVKMKWILESRALPSNGFVWKWATSTQIHKYWRGSDPEISDVAERQSLIGLNFQSDVDAFRRLDILLLVLLDI